MLILRVGDIEYCLTGMITHLGIMIITNIVYMYIKTVITTMIICNTQ